MPTPLVIDRRTVDTSPPEGDRRALHTPLTHLLSSSNMMGDGTLWSHAATLGEYIKGSTFKLDDAAANNFVRVFDSGYPQKAPVDYEHESVTKDSRTDTVPWTRRAGEIIEVAAVLGLDDLNLAMRKQVADETARRLKIGNRKSVNPLGVWIRWEPTARALAMVQAREVTEMSIAFHPDFPHNGTGEGQGPTLLSVALTNTPFLDQMTPVAASRSEGGYRADTPEHHTERHMATTTKSFALAQLLGRSGPFGSDDEAMDASVARITSLNQQVADLEPAKAVIETLSAELGEPDREKIVGNIRALKATAQAAVERAREERKAKIATEADAFLVKHESRIASVPLRAHFLSALSVEMEAGATIADTVTAKVIQSLPVTFSGRAALTDAGTNQSRETDLDELTKKLQTDEKLNYADALVKAERTLSQARR